MLHIVHVRVGMRVRGIVCCLIECGGVYVQGCMCTQLRVEDIRGNLQTRWTKLESGAYDALLLAQAGVQRLGWHDRIAEVPRIACVAIPL